MFVGSVPLSEGTIRYQFQTWGGKRSPESRLTDGIKPLRDLATEGDLLLFQRRADSLDQFRFILIGLPVGDLVFAQNAAAGEIWSEEGIFALESVTIVGPRMSTLWPIAPRSLNQAGLVYDRQCRIFGDRGQEILNGLKVGVVGLGGAGSLISEWLARLGVGHILAIDYDRVEPSNLPRVIGATRWDTMTLFSLSRSRVLRRIGWRLSRYKVHIARRVARVANPRIEFESIVGDVLDEPVARRLCGCDFIFWAADPIQTRLVFNSLVQQYLIPGVQVGSKVPIEKTSGKIGQIFTASRPVFPFPGGGCLECNGLIPTSSLQEEASTEEERRGSVTWTIP